INTPLVAPGMDVVLKVENDFEYTVTKGFKPKDPKHYVINIYLTDSKGRAKGKPIAQLPSADGPTATDGDRQLRQRVLSAKGMRLKSRIVDKNLGNFTHTELRNSIRVLEVDYHKEGSEWKFGKTPYKPILGYSDGQGILRFPKVEIMDGVSPGVIREINKLAGVERPKDIAPGSI